MSLRQLEAFYWAVILGSFAAAAKRLFVTQSTISMRIRELELHLGVELFDRSSRAVKPTAVGLELMHYARRMLGLASQIKKQITPKAKYSEQIRIGVAEVISLTWLPQLLKKISMNFPQVRQEVTQMLADDLFKYLNKGVFDLILTPGPENKPGLHVSSLGSVKFSWMANSKLKFQTNRGLLNAQELANQPIIGYAPQSFLRSTLDDWFIKGHVQPNYLLRCTSILVAAAMTHKGIGCSYLPKICFESDIAARKLELVPSDIESHVYFNSAILADENNPLVFQVAELAYLASTFIK